MRDCKANKFFVIGNGGSASTASHVACDIGKNTALPDVPRFRIMSLVDNMATFSAYANDCGYDNVFAEQLANLLREDDVLIAISASGNSPNILNAIKLARNRNAIYYRLERLRRWRTCGDSRYTHCDPQSLH